MIGHDYRLRSGLRARATAIARRAGRGAGRRKRGSLCGLDGPRTDCHETAGTTSRHNARSIRIITVLIVLTPAGLG